MPNVLFQNRASLRRNLAPGLAWTALIFGLSVMPAVNLPETWADLLSWDKLAHAAIYGIQTWLLLRGLLAAGHLNGGPILTVLAFSIGFGAAMEVVQWAFFPGRYFELTDIIANTVGTLLGWLIFTKRSNRRSAVP